jgi:hypothetical protein
MIAIVLSALALLGLALLLGATVYESVVMAPNYERDIPASLAIAREFLKRTTPAHYFRVLSPLTQLLSLGSLVASWHLSAVRWPLSTSLVILVLLDLITFTFHYPRLALMFKAPIPADPARLRRAAREWAVGNLVRAVLLLVALLAVLQAVTLLAQHAA